MAICIHLGDVTIELDERYLDEPEFRELLSQAEIELLPTEGNIQALMGLMTEGTGGGASIPQQLREKLMTPLRTLFGSMPGAKWLEVHGYTHVFQVAGKSYQELAADGALPRVITELSHGLRALGVKPGSVTRDVANMLTLEVLRRRLRKGRDGGGAKK